MTKILCQKRNKRNKIIIIHKGKIKCFFFVRHVVIFYKAPKLLNQWKLKFKNSHEKICWEYASREKCRLVENRLKYQRLFLKKYRKFDFVTQFLRNGSTKIQSFGYHFVLLFSWHCLWKAQRCFQATPAKWPIYLSSAVKGLRRNCSYLYTFRFILSPSHLI